MIKNSMETFVEREKYLINVQNEILKGGISVQDWTTFQLENAYISFCSGAYLACIIMCQAAIESYMHDDEGLKDRSFYDLIEHSSYDKRMKFKLHKLREYRNKWIHINEHKDNVFYIDNKGLEDMAIFAYRLTLEVFHYYPYI
jgi:hypothetical protein